MQFQLRTRTLDEFKQLACAFGEAIKPLAEKRRVVVCADSNGNGVGKSTFAEAMFEVFGLTRKDWRRCSRTKDNQGGFYNLNGTQEAIDAEDRYHLWLDAMLDYDLDQYGVTDFYLRPDAGVLMVEHALAGRASQRIIDRQDIALHIDFDGKVAAHAPPASMLPKGRIVTFNVSDELARSPAFAVFCKSRNILTSG